MKLILTGLLLISPLASADEDSALFAPALAADQGVVTSESLDKEFQQILALSSWQKAQDKLRVANLKFEQAKRDLARGKELRKSGTITESKFSGLYFDYRVLEVDMINLPIEVIKFRMTAQYHLLRVIEEGNPGVDRRKDQAKLMLEGAELEIKTLTASLELAQTAKQLAEGFVKNGKTLRATNALTASDMEKRELAYQSAVIHIEAIESQLKLARMARESFTRALARL